MVIEMLRALIQKIFRSFGAAEKYRPERHYMRGPGPKSRERADHAGEWSEAGRS